MTKLFDVQQAVYQRLTQDEELMNLVNGIYDYVPKKSDFPFVVLGRAYTTPYRTKTTDGERIELTLDIWSTYNGKKETTDIVKRIQASLTSDLTVEGAFVLSQDVKNLEVIEEDADLVHGTLGYEIVVDLEE